MSTWKRILTEDDGNLATKNLSTGSARTFTLSSSNTLTFLSQHGTEFLKFTSGPVTPNADSVSIQGAALDIRHSVSSLAGILALREATDNGSSQVNLRAPASVSTTVTFTLPGADGSNGQAIVTDGSGNLSFSTISGGGGSIDGSGGTDRIAIWSDSDTLTSDSEITYSSGTHKITAGSFTAAVVTGVAATGVVTSQTLQSAEINVGLVSSQTVGAFGVGSRLLVKGGSFQGTLSAGRVMRYSQGQGTNPITTADHTSEAGATTMLFCSTDATNPQELLLEGSIKLATNQGWSTAAQGTPLYLGSSSGVVQPAPPSTQGYYSRIIGYVIDASNAIVYFCPDRSWVKIG